MMHGVGLRLRADVGDGVHVGLDVDDDALGVAARRGRSWYQPFGAPPTIALDDVGD